MKKKVEENAGDALDSLKSIGTAVKIKMPVVVKSACEILYMPSSHVLVNLSKLLSMARIQHGDDVEIVIMKNQVTILKQKGGGQMNINEAEDLRLALDFFEVAENLREGIIRYFEHHILPGRFLIACLENDLQNAIGYASTQHWDYIFGIMNFLHNFAPTECWGSKEIVREWVK